jgi:hypothetical protein
LGVRTVIARPNGRYPQISAKEGVLKSWWHQTSDIKLVPLKRKSTKNAHDEQTAKEAAPNSISSIKSTNQRLGLLL